MAPPDTDIPVIPVYQLNQLLGYVFDQKTLLLSWAAGEPINVLIGLNTQGILTGLKIIKHNEPIFIYGLGPKPMQDFLLNTLITLYGRFIIGADIEWRSDLF